MKNVMYVLTVLGMLSGFASFAQASEDVKSLVPGYIQIQKALASDDLEQAKKAAKNLRATKVNWDSQAFKGLISPIQEISQAQSLKTARAGLKKMTDPFEKWVKKTGSSEFDVIYCPMAGAKWIQKKGEIENPYYGKEMLRCGEKTS